MFSPAQLIISFSRYIHQQFSPAKTTKLAIPRFETATLPGFDHFFLSPRWIGSTVRKVQFRQIIIIVISRYEIGSLRNGSASGHDFFVKKRINI